MVFKAVICIALVLTLGSVAAQNSACVQAGSQLSQSCAQFGGLVQANMGLVGEVLSSDPPSIPS